MDEVVRSGLSKRQQKKDRRRLKLQLREKFSIKNKPVTVSADVGNERLRSKQVQDEWPNTVNTANRRANPSTSIDSEGTGLQGDLSERQMIDQTGADCHPKMIASSNNRGGSVKRLEGQSPAQVDIKSKPHLRNTIEHKLRDVARTGFDHKSTTGSVNRKPDSTVRQRKEDHLCAHVDLTAAPSPMEQSGQSSHEASASDEPEHEPGRWRLNHKQDSDRKHCGSRKHLLTRARRTKLCIAAVKGWIVPIDRSRARQTAVRNLTEAAKEEVVSAKRRHSPSLDQAVIKSLERTRRQSSRSTSAVRSDTSSVRRHLGVKIDISKDQTSNRRHANKAITIPSRTTIVNVRDAFESFSRFIEDNDRSTPTGSSNISSAASTNPEPPQACPSSIDDFNVVSRVDADVYIGMTDVRRVPGDEAGVKKALQADASNNTIIIQVDSIKDTAVAQVDTTKDTTVVDMDTTKETTTAQAGTYKPHSAQEPDLTVEELPGYIANDDLTTKSDVHDDNVSLTDVRPDVNEMELRTIYADTTDDDSSAGYVTAIDDRDTPAVGHTRQPVHINHAFSNANHQYSSRLQERDDNNAEETLQTTTRAEHGPLAMVSALDAIAPSRLQPPTESMSSIEDHRAGRATALEDLAPMYKSSDEDTGEANHNSTDRDGAEHSAAVEVGNGLRSYDYDTCGLSSTGLQHPDDLNVDKKQLSLKNTDGDKDELPSDRHINQDEALLLPDEEIMNERKELLPRRYTRNDGALPPDDNADDDQEELLLDDDTNDDEELPPDSDVDAGEEPPIQVPGLEEDTIALDVRTTESDIESYAVATDDEGENTSVVIRSDEEPIYASAGREDKSILHDVDKIWEDLTGYAKNVPRQYSSQDSPVICFQATVTPLKRRRTAGVSNRLFPPISEQTFGLLQEKLWQEPFWLLIATMFLNQTSGHAARPIFWELKRLYPTPEELSKADVDEVTELIHCLGLQVQRSRRIIGFAKAWVETPPKQGRLRKRLHYPNKGDGKQYSDDWMEDGECIGAIEIGHLPGCGPYAYDSWRIFCRDILRGVAQDYNGLGAGADFEAEWKRVQPLDKELRPYLRWMWLKEGLLWDADSGKTRPLTQEEQEIAIRGEVEPQDEDEKVATIAAAETREGGRKKPRGGGLDGAITATLDADNMPRARRGARESLDADYTPRARRDTSDTRHSSSSRRSLRLRKQ